MPRGISPPRRQVCGHQASATKMPATTTTAASGAPPAALRAPLPGRVQLPRGSPEPRAAPPQAAPRGAARRAPTNVQPSFFGSLVVVVGEQNAGLARTNIGTLSPQRAWGSPRLLRGASSLLVPLILRTPKVEDVNWRNARPGEIERSLRSSLVNTSDQPHAIVLSHFRSNFLTFPRVFSPSRRESEKFSACGALAAWASP